MYEERNLEKVQQVSILGLSPRVRDRFSQSSPPVFAEANQAERERRNKM